MDAAATGGVTRVEGATEAAVAAIRVDLRALRRVIMGNLFESVKRDPQWSAPENLQSGLAVLGCDLTIDGYDELSPGLNAGVERVKWGRLGSLDVLVVVWV